MTALAEQLGIDVHRSPRAVMDELVTALGDQCSLCGVGRICELTIGVWSPTDRPPLVYVVCPLHTAHDVQRYLGWHVVPERPS